MVKIDEKNLEKALDNQPNIDNSSQAPKMTKEQEIIFHQGALATLVNERAELLRMFQNVEIVMQAHLKRLEELGVKIPTKKE